MTPRAQRTKGAKPAAGGPSSPSQMVGVVEVGRLRAEYGLSASTLARLLQVSEATLAKWDGGKGQPDADALKRIERAGELLQGLARVMRAGFISTWLESPNDACKEAGGHTPLDLIQRGDYARIEQMIYFFEAGEPF